jgi:parallel beta-helix repeat protein
MKAERTALIERSSYFSIKLVSLLIVLIFVMGLVDAAKITVGPLDEDYPQIQKAIDNSSDGDVIEVHSGTYQERLRVVKAVSLIGLDTGSGLPVINASGSSNSITLMANGSTVKGFNLTGSGHCGCGSAGIQVASSNNTVLDNIIYKNKYGIYVKPENFNNTFVSNDLLQNEISAYDPGNNSWSGTLKAEGLQKLVELVVGKQMKGNHYSDYDEPEEGCNDTNEDGFCDMPRKIDGGNSVDPYPSFSKGNS